MHPTITRLVINEHVRDLLREAQPSVRSEGPRRLRPLPKLHRWSERRLSRPSATGLAT